MPISLTSASPTGETPDEFHQIVAAADAERKRNAALGSVKRIVGIHSGKGGVGKTFLTVNLAYALAEHGLEVGILDADVDCPNVPKFLGATQRLYTNDQKQFVPINHRGVKIVSMGSTNDDDGTPILIRGPAKHRVAIDLLTNTQWGALDILLVDLPPGTSDVPMSLLEFGGMEGMLYVTTPQKEAITDTRKSIRMGATFGIRALGVVENMGGSIFGTGKAELLAKEFSIPYLGSIPLNEQILLANERGDIAFTDVALEPIVAPLVEALLHGENP